MIKLHPIPEAKFNCPYDNQQLQLMGWYIPGMRNLADLKCPKCGREYYGDLLTGQALYTPILLEKDSCKVHDSIKVNWFADWLQRSYKNRSDKQLDFSEEKFRPIQKPLLLNCLDTLYGHSLLKLLNAQYYIDHHPEMDLIILVPKILRWMVPEGVAAIWTVDLPLKRGIEWNDWLGAELHRRLESYNECWISVAYSHPHPQDFSIERFSKVSPFSDISWNGESPVISYIWRDDRLWHSTSDIRLKRVLEQKIRSTTIWRKISIFEQRSKVIKLANLLKKRFPQIDFAVVGFGDRGDFPKWINDMRTKEVNENIEREWCCRYANSNVIIGVHGSNMLIPSAHSGAVVELVPEDRLGNIIQDLLMSDLDCRESLYRFRLVPITTNPNELSIIVSSLIETYQDMVQLMRRSNLQHNSNDPKVKNED